MVNYIHKGKEYYKFHIHKLFFRVLVINYTDKHAKTGRLRLTGRFKNQKKEKEMLRKTVKL